MNGSNAHEKLLFAHVRRMVQITDMQRAREDILRVIEDGQAMLRFWHEMNAKRQHEPAEILHFRSASEREDDGRR